MYKLTLITIVTLLLSCKLLDVPEDKYIPPYTIRLEGISMGIYSLYIYSIPFNAKVRTCFENQVMAGGTHGYQWDIKNDKGKQVSRGVYRWKFYNDKTLKSQAIFIIE